MTKFGRKLRESLEQERREYGPYKAIAVQVTKRSPTDKMILDYFIKTCTQRCGIVETIIRDGTYKDMYAGIEWKTFDYYIICDNELNVNILRSELASYIMDSRIIWDKVLLRFQLSCAIPMIREVRMDNLKKKWNITP